MKKKYILSYRSVKFEFLPLKFNTFRCAPAISNFSLLHQMCCEFDNPKNVNTLLLPSKAHAQLRTVWYLVEDSATYWRY